MLVNTMTVCCTLHDNGVFSRIAVKKKHSWQLKCMSWRLDFARQYRGWCVADWKSVFWTDESNFKIGKNFKQVHIWRTAYEQYSSSCEVLTFKSEQTFLIIWGDFVEEHRSKLVFMLRNWHKATHFVEFVYDSQLLQFIGKVSHGVFMEDCALVHCSRAPKE